MKTIGDKLEAFSITGVKPGFNQHEENGVSAFETISEQSFPGKWKVIYFWPKDFTFVCPTEIVGFDKLARQFEERDAVLLGGSTDNEFSKLGWRRFGRYAATWCVMTLASTLAIQAVEQGAGLQWAWLAKPAVEAALAAVTFVVYRVWIYK